MRTAFVITASALALFFTHAHAQSNPDRVDMTTEEAAAFVKGKSLRATGDSGSRTVNFEFKDDGTMYGYFTRSSDIGKWRIENGKLCMTWRRVLYDGCGKLVRVGDNVIHLYPDDVTLHVAFEK